MFDDRIFPHDELLEKRALQVEPHGLPAPTDWPRSLRALYPLRIDFTQCIRTWPTVEPAMNLREGDAIVKADDAARGAVGIE